MTHNLAVIAQQSSLRLVRDNGMSPDDGNPYFVEHVAGDYGASLACALDTGELTHHRTGDTFQLTRVQAIFLQREADKLSDY